MSTLYPALAVALLFGSTLGDGAAAQDAARARRRLRGPAGSKVDLTFERGGEPIRVILVLRRVV